MVVFSGSVMRNSTRYFPTILSTLVALIWMCWWDGNIVHWKEVRLWRQVQSCSTGSFRGYHSYNWLHTQPSLELCLVPQADHTQWPWGKRVMEPDYIALGKILGSLTLQLFLKMEILLAKYGSFVSFVKMGVYKGLFSS